MVDLLRKDGGLERKPGLVIPRSAGNAYTIVVAVPSMGMWNAQFGQSLVGLMLRGAGTQLPYAISQQIYLHSVLGSLLPKNRQIAVKTALQAKATHLLFLDSDMQFPPDTLHRLLSHKKDIIGANCPIKRVPSVWTGRFFDGTKEGAPIDSNERQGIEKLWRLGFGAMLINMRVFDKVKEPWFDFRLEQTPAGSYEYVGEDWFFCSRCEEQGIEIWVDHDLSKEIGHIGFLTFTADLVPEGIEKTYDTQIRAAL